MTPGGRAACPSSSTCPTAASPAGLIVFSHGLGGSCESATEWSCPIGQPFGFAAIALQHPGSDDQHPAQQLPACPAPQAFNGRDESRRTHPPGRRPALRAQSPSATTGAAGRHQRGAPKIGLCRALVWRRYGATAWPANAVRLSPPSDPADPRVRCRPGLEPFGPPCGFKGPGLAHRFGHWSACLS
jgi:hypothetical protein